MTCSQCGLFKPKPNTSYSYAGPVCVCEYQVTGHLNSQYNNYQCSEDTILMQIAEGINKLGSKMDAMIEVIKDWKNNERTRYLL